MCHGFYVANCKRLPEATSTRLVAVRRTVHDTIPPSCCISFLGCFHPMLVTKISTLVLLKPLKLWNYQLCNIPVANHAYTV